MNTEPSIAGLLQHEHLPYFYRLDAHDDFLAVLTENEPARADLTTSGVDPAESNPSDVTPSTVVFPEEQPTEALDDMLWPLLPYFGARAATLQGDMVMFGTIAVVDQTVRLHEILYVLQYDDGDLEHLDEPEAAAAVALALAKLPVTPLLR